MTSDAGAGPDGGDAAAESGSADATDELATPVSVGGTAYYLPAGKSIKVRANNGPAVSVNGDAAKAASFTFAPTFKLGDSYTVTVDASDPPCWVKNGVGKVTASVNDIEVRCQLVASASATSGATLGPSALPSDFPSAQKPTSLTIKTDRPTNDVLLSLYVPAIQSAKHARSWIGVSVDGVAQTSERLQSYYGDAGESLTHVALTNLAAGTHVIKAVWRAETSPVTVLAASPPYLPDMNGVVQSGAPSTYAAQLSVIALDSLSTFDGVAAPVTVGNGADAGSPDSGLMQVSSTPLDGTVAGRKALALLHVPAATSPANVASVGRSAGYTGSLLQLTLDGKVAATNELLSVYDPPGYDRAQSVVTLVDLAQNTKPTLAAQWQSVGDPAQTGSLSPDSFLGAAYFSAAAKSARGVFTSATANCAGTTSNSASATSVLTAQVTAAHPGKALVIAQLAHLIQTGGFNVSGQADVFQTSQGDGGNISAPLLSSYIQNGDGFGRQGATMIGVFDVAAGLNAFDVRLISRAAVPGNSPACIHSDQGDPLSQSTLSVLLLE